MAQKSPTGVPAGDNPSLPGQAGSNPTPAAQTSATPPSDDDSGSLDADISTAALDSQELADQMPSWLDVKPHQMLNMSSLIWDTELIHGQIRKLRPERVMALYSDVKVNVPTMPVFIVVKAMGGM